ncbi:MAG: GatB/YqeY domain-containing protein [Polyangiaceae bacterium]|nr:GatB/YqeY domain-containing protein [Polyangiaceae bacterium]
MSLSAQIKKDMFAAMKAKKSLEKEVLRTLMGEITMSAARESVDDIGDEAVQAIIRKLIKSNREALAAGPDADRAKELQAEIDCVTIYLPRSLSSAEIVALLAEVEAAIQAAPNQGPAMGIAMKVLKGGGHTVEAKDVAAAVGQIRG